MSAPIVDQYFNAVERFRGSVKTYAPFTFLAYRSIIPSQDDDMIEFACKICDVASLRFLIGLVASAVSPIFLFIPFIPIVLDIGRAIYLLARGEEFGEIAHETEKGSQRSKWRGVLAIGLLALSLFGVHAACHQGELVP